MESTLSQREEQIMLAIWVLKDDAYLVAVKKYLSDIFGKKWTVGAIHKPLRRMEEAGYLVSSLGEATAKRGGRAKKIYQITGNGLAILSENKRIKDILWADFPGYKLSGSLSNE